VSPLSWFLERGIGKVGKREKSMEEPSGRLSSLLKIKGT
jgi:hypothetical protein